MIATDEQVALIETLIRVDQSDESDKIVKLYIGAAETWLKNAGCTVDYSNDLCVDIVSMYVGKRYDEPSGSGSGGNAELTLAALAEQLRLSQKTAALDGDAT